MEILTYLMKLNGKTNLDDVLSIRISDDVESSTLTL